MSEMEWEEAPVVYVPRVRHWFGRWYRDWHRGVYPPRHGVTFVWGVFIVPWALWQALKAFIFWSAVALVLLVYPVWIGAEMITYSRRHKRAVLRQWGPYMGELYGEDPPPHAA